MTVMGDAWMEISSDRGSTPRRSTKTEQVNLCICYYRIQEYVLFGVSKKIKVTTLYVTKVIYSVVIFMLYCGYEFNKSGLCAQTRASSLAGGMPVW